MNRELELLKTIKNKTLERIMDEFGELGVQLSERKLTLWDARCIIYEEVNKQAQSIIDREGEKAMEEFR